MSDGDRKAAIKQDMKRRRKRHSQESSVERRRRLEHEASMKMHRRDCAFEAECKEQGVLCTTAPSKTTKETALEKRARMKQLRQKFTKPTSCKPEKQRRETVDGDGKCEYRDYLGGCECNSHQQKRSLRLLGRGGTPNSCVRRYIFCQIHHPK